MPLMIVLCADVEGSRLLPDSSIGQDHGEAVSILRVGSGVCAPRVVDAGGRLPEDGRQAADSRNKLIANQVQFNLHFVDSITIAYLLKQCRSLGIL